MVETHPSCTVRHDVVLNQPAAIVGDHRGEYDHHPFLFGCLPLKLASFPHTFPQPSTCPRSRSPTVNVPISYHTHKCQTCFADQDVRVYLSASDECQFDLVVAAETLQYLGPLGHVFATCYKVLKPGGLLAFTVDRQQGQAGEDEEKEEEKDVDDQGPPASGGQGDAGGTAEVGAGYIIDGGSEWVGRIRDGNGRR